MIAWLGHAPSPLVQEPHGKPRLEEEEIEFSISRLEDWCAVALSTDCPVGVDLEPIRPLAGLEGIVQQFFPPATRAAYDAAAREDRMATFFWWWTRIEAAVKASGTGLDASGSCFNGVACQSFDVPPALALAVAAKADDTVIVAPGIETALVL